MAANNTILHGTGCRGSDRLAFRREPGRMSGSTPAVPPDDPWAVVVGPVWANGLCFEVAQAGRGSHLALCLHGFPETHWSWRHQMPLLARLGYRVWAPNQRGYAGSDRPAGIGSYAIDRIVDDAIALFDASGASRLTVIGHDWGGAIAWFLAMGRRRPIERLVVMNLPHPLCMIAALRRWPQRRRSWYVAAALVPRLPEWWLGRHGAARLKRLFRDLAVDRSRFPEEVLAVYAAAANEPGALRAMVDWYRAVWLYPPTIGGGGCVEVPVLIVWGEADRVLGLETLEGTDRYVPDLTIRRLPGVSHWVQQEAPEAVNAILSAWLPEQRG